MGLNEDINLGAITEALNNKVDRDADNLSTAGQKVFDGQWTAASVVLTTATAVDTYTIDVSNMLPIDNYSYECLVSVEVATSDNTAINIGSDVLAYAIAVGQNRGGATGVPTTYFRGNAILPVGTGRQIIVTIAGVAPIRNTTYLLAYRRIGTNS